MTRTFWLWFAAAAVAFGVSVVAADRERPTEEFRNIMKSNAAMASPAGIRAKVAAKDYDAIAKDATTLKANLEKIELFWSQRKVADAVDFAKAGIKAAADLEAAAKAKSDDRILQAQRAFTFVCNDCHQVHRLIIPTENRYEIM
jgi:hypothetical protein